MLASVSKSITNITFRIVTIGADLTKNDVPLSPIRQLLVRFLITWGSKIQLKMCNVSFTLKVMKPGEINYSNYLGENYLETYKDPCNKEKRGKISTYVCNHSSFLDIITLLAALHSKVNFVAGDHTLAMPGLGRCVKALGCITMPMGGSAEALERTKALIEERQRLVEQGTNFHPSVIFPEGTCTNNTSLVPFRKGAFLSLKTVMPMTIKYRWTEF